MGEREEEMNMKARTSDPLPKRKRFFFLLSSFTFLRWVTVDSDASSAENPELSEVSPFKPILDQNIALGASPAARN